MPRHCDVIQDALFVQASLKAADVAFVQFPQLSSDVMHDVLLVQFSTKSDEEL